MSILGLLLILFSPSFESYSDTRTDPRANCAEDEPIEPGRKVVENPIVTACNTDREADSKSEKSSDQHGVTLDKASV